jgi:hypothetical protein
MLSLSIGRPSARKKSAAARVAAARSRSAGRPIAPGRADPFTCALALDMPDTPIPPTDVDKILPHHDAIFNSDGW